MAFPIVGVVEHQAWLDEGPKPSLHLRPIDPDCPATSTGAHIIQCQTTDHPTLGLRSFLCIACLRWVHAAPPRARSP